VANSPLFRARQKIDSLQHAITRLGRNTVRTVIIGLAMNQLFKPKQLLLDTYFHAIWKQSVNVSAVSRALALRCGHLDKEQAMLAGLLHQIGKLPILTLAERFPEIAKDKAILDSHLEKLHTVIGKLVMEKWDMPEALSRVAWEYRDFQRDSGPEADYVDVVQVAFVESELVTNPASSSMSPISRPSANLAWIRNRGTGDRGSRRGSTRMRGDSAVTRTGIRGCSNSGIRRACLGV